MSLRIACSGCGAHRLVASGDAAGECSVCGCARWDRVEDVDLRRKCSSIREQVETLAREQLVEIAEAAVVVAQTLDLLSSRERVRPSTLRHLAGLLRAGLA